MEWEINHATKKDVEIKIIRENDCIEVVGVVHDLGFGMMHTIIKRPKYKFDNYLPVYYLPLYSLN